MWGKWLCKERVKGKVSLICHLVIYMREGISLLGALALQAFAGGGHGQVGTSLSSLWARLHRDSLSLFFFFLISGRTLKVNPEYGKDSG